MGPSINVDKAVKMAANTTKPFWVRATFKPKACAMGLPKLSKPKQRARGKLNISKHTASTIKVLASKGVAW